MSSKPIIYNLINHPYYLTLTRFIDASGFKISKYSVREALKKIEGVLDLSKLHQLLSTFFSDLLVIQIDSQIDNHDYIITPCFLLQTEGNQFFIYVVLKIEEDKVLIFEQDKKDYTISTDEFQDLLKGSILIFKEEETYNPTEKILKEYNQEQEENKEYLKNIKVIDDFISEKECEKIIAFCEEDNLFKRSKVGVGYGRVSDHRTSSSAFIENNKNSLIISDLKEKIAVFLDCKIHKIESLQVVRYYKSEGFDPHFDAAINLKRKLTCLLYLNDGFLGGETYFPELDFGVTPKLGRLLVFKNLDENDEIIRQSLHQGSPILDGVKYACNIWIKK
jgi:hypothetical protein